MAGKLLEQPRILNSNCEARPTALIDIDYVPPGSEPYLVADGDNWWSLAQKKGVDAKWLVKYNFQTNEYKHVNWYLHNFVGCTKKSPDGNNFSFTTAARNATWTSRAGVIYVPKSEVKEPVPPQPIPTPAASGCQNLLFSAHFYAESVVADQIAVAVKGLEAAGLLSAAGKAGAKVLGWLEYAWIIRGILVMEIEGANESPYLWKFGGLAAGKTVPFSGDGPHYSTNQFKIRTNLEVLDPRVRFRRRKAEFCLSRGGASFKVLNALERRIQDNYRPFPEGIPTISRHLQLPLALTKSGPLGLVTSIPGYELELVPQGYLSDQAITLYILDMIRQMKQWSKK